ncbi:Tkl/drk protein kinase, partial [Globisporangium splendens]
MVYTSCLDCRHPIFVNRHARLRASTVLVLLFCLVSLWTRSSHALLRNDRNLMAQVQPALAVTRSSSSDFVAVYYNLFQKNQQSTLSPVVFKQEVPTEIQTRLSKYSLRFHELPELLKRALLWESGYSLGDNASLAQIHTLCGLTMAQIALSETEFSASSCDTERCSSGSSDRLYARLGACDSVCAVPAKRYALVPPQTESAHDQWLEEYAQSVFLDNSHSGSMTGSGAAGTGRLVLSDLNVSANVKDKHGVYVDPAFQCDGTSSDFAQQFYRRSLADAESTAALDKLTIEQPLPKEMEQRLSDAGLSFNDLPSLLQRALVWDSGYAFAKGDGGSETLRPVYVKCGLAMSDIAIPRESVSNAEFSHRALSCTNDRIVRETRCAIANADAVERSNRIAVWADGGVGTATPDMNIKKYSVESENASFVLLGIHATRDDLDAGTSSECIDKPSMIIPCVPYASTGHTDNANSTGEGEWCRPKPGALVTSWLRQVAKEKKVSLLYLIPILIAVALAVTGLAAYIRRTSFKRIDGKRDESRRNVTAIISTPDRTYASGRFSLSQRSSLAVGEARLSDFSSASIESFAAFSANNVLNTLANHPSLRLSSFLYDQLQFHELVSKQGDRIEVWRGVYRGSNVATKRLAKTGKILLQLAWEKNKMHIALGIANAMCYLHQQRPAVFHSDLKAKNVLLSSELDAKLIGCGARRWSKADGSSAPRSVPSPFWTAPEVLRSHAHSEKADMYSFGVVLSELDTHQLPYEGITSLRTGENLSPLEILEKAIANELRPALSPFCPLEVADLIEACLHADPQQRPSAREAIVVLARVPIVVVSAKTYSF